MKFQTTVCLNDYCSDAEDLKKVLLWTDSTNEYTMKYSREELTKQGYKIEEHKTKSDVNYKSFYITWTVEIPGKYITIF